MSGLYFCEPEKSRLAIDWVAENFIIVHCSFIPSRILRFLSFVFTCSG
jgi:hypothetical protein